VNFMLESRRARLLSTVACVAGLTLALACGSRADDPPAAGDGGGGGATAPTGLVKVGDKLDLAKHEVVDTDGKAWNLGDFKDRVIFLNFHMFA
jgi:hypothetical protein